MNATGIDLAAKEGTEGGAVTSDVSIPKVLGPAKALPPELQTFVFRDGIVIASLAERDGIRCYSRFVFDDGEPLPTADTPKTSFIC